MNGLKRISNQLSAQARNFLGLGRQQSVAMIHLGRCGSTVLGNMLADHPNIFWAGEIYEELFQEFKKAGHEPHSFQNLITNPVRTVTESRARLRARMAAIYGFEIKPFHSELIDVPLDALIQGLEREGFDHFIILDRRNRLKKICSALLALKTGRFSYGLNEKIEMKTVYLDVESIEIEYNCKPLIELLKGYDQAFSNLSTYLENRNTLELFYEDDIEHDPLHGYKRVCDFLAVEPSTKAKVPNKKITNRPLSSVIQNFDEVQNYLKDSGYEWMLEV